MAKNAPLWTILKSTRRLNEQTRSKLTRLRLPNPDLTFADFDVVVGDDGEDHKNPDGEDTHSRNCFRNQAGQYRPSTAED